MSGRKKEKLPIDVIAAFGVCIRAEGNMANADPGRQERLDYAN